MAGEMTLCGSDYAEAPWRHGQWLDYLLGIETAAVWRSVQQYGCSVATDQPFIEAPVRESTQ